MLSIIPSIRQETDHLIETQQVLIISCLVTQEKQTTFKMRTAASSGNFLPTFWNNLSINRLFQNINKKLPLLTA